MAKGLYGWLSKMWQDMREMLTPLYRQRYITWRKQPAIVRIEKPTRVDKARRLGYKAKQGFVVVRVRVKKGIRKRPKPAKGRRPKRYGRFLPKKISLQVIAEQRANRKFPNLEVLNSYWVGSDSKYDWYEVILVDPNHPAIKNDPTINWICRQRGRVFRGLTAAGRRARGL